MSKLMSVAMTEQAVVDRIKTVTRRTNWWEDKHGRRLVLPGDSLTWCRKIMGRKPGEPLIRLADVKVVDVRRERLALIAEDTEYARAEVAREGFPGMEPAEFVDRFFVQAQGLTYLTEVTRIEVEYMPELCSVGICGNPAHRAHTPCCSSTLHEGALCCEHYNRFHFVEVDQCTPALHEQLHQRALQILGTAGSAA